MAMTDEEMIRQAARAIQGGDKGTGKRLLLGIVRANPRSAQAWLLMSGVVDSEGEQRECLLRTLAIEPENNAAQVELAWLDMRLESETPVAPGGTTEAAQVPAPSGYRLRAPTERQKLDESVRVRGFRNTMLAGAMLLTLMCGLTLLVITATRIVPQAQERMRPTPETVLYTATLWCPACESANSAIILWEKVGDGVSRGAKVGGLRHNTPVSVLAESWSAAEKQTYLKVAAQGQKGWVPEVFVRKPGRSPDDSG